MEIKILLILFGSVLALGSSSFLNKPCYCKPGPPICASDWRTYYGECNMKCHSPGSTVLFQGRCEDSLPNPFPNHAIGIPHQHQEYKSPYPSVPVSISTPPIVPNQYIPRPLAFPPQKPLLPFSPSIARRDLTDDELVVKSNLGSTTSPPDNHNLLSPDILKSHSPLEVTEPQPHIIEREGSTKTPLSIGVHQHEVPDVEEDRKGIVERKEENSTEEPVTKTTEVQDYKKEDHSIE